MDGRQFEKVSNDPTLDFQKKVQRCLLGMKKAFNVKTYRTLYPSASQPGLFFGLAKVHKVPKGSTNVEDLPLRPVISNIGTSTYNISKFLAKELSPLTKSVYTIDSTKDFIERMKGKSIGDEYKMVSFDVSSLFTNVPLDFTINLILDKIYREKAIKTKLKKEDFRVLLELCTKHMHFSYNGIIYRQVDGVAMGSPLGPVLANIFMVHLEETIVPTLNVTMPLWFRYVDDTFTFINENEIENVRNILNSFHPDIKFTCEIEANKSISFLDVKLIRKEDGSFITEVYRKETDTNIYIHWKSFAPDTWKIGTLKGLFRRAYVVCSSTEGLKKEIDHLNFVFTKINKYPEEVVKKTLRQLQEKIRMENSGNTSDPNVNNIIDNKKGTECDNIHPYMVLPYKGYLGNQILYKFKKVLYSLLPMTVIPRITFRGKKLGSFFPIKDKIAKEHLSDLIYEYGCDVTTFCDPIERYIGETSVRIGNRSNEHANTDKQSAIYKHAKTHNHPVTLDNFDILAKGYKNKINRKIAEALYIKDKKPNLNEQVYSYKLQLFN